MDLGFQAPIRCVNRDAYEIRCVTNTVDEGIICIRDYFLTKHHLHQCVESMFKKIFKHLYQTHGQGD